MSTQVRQEDLLVEPEPERPSLEAMNLAQMVNVKLAPNRVQGEFNNARISARGFVLFNQGERCRMLQPR